ncbi:hypothetical protein SH580_20715 [Coraliomargarita algicola]|uniref:DUF3108 domain-containing protein n=1 Tax=Coraliomargarita algicola TaxID=3092156 RepID=A0ABZ0RL76_9BACT|nr:hypothetical protein [Coraliomargarita sp. J2-16]WPJ95843.1 hypothetical protein SH580_20715 [Coraliomargarita sp. J2-16]
MKLLKLISIPLLVLFGNSLWAQQKGEDIQLKFRALAVNYPLLSGVYLTPTGGEPIRIYSNSRTEWINYNGPNPITFYAQKSAADGASERIPIASFDAINAPKDPLLVFSRKNSEEMNYNIGVVSDNVSDAPSGSYRIFNFTQKQIAGMIDDQRFLLAPKASAFAIISNPKNFEVTVQLAENDQGKAKRLYASTWTFSDNFRYLVFILPTDDRTRGNIDIRLIPDLIRKSVH